MLELIIGVGVLIVVLGMAFNLLQPVSKLQELSRTRANLLQNQTLAMQRISQQLSIYARTVSIQIGGSDRLTINDVAGNKIIAFYQANATEGVSVLYMSTQVPPDAAGANQLTDPYNVEVLSFKVDKLDSKKLRINLSLREKNSGRIADFSEVVQLINGEVL